MPDRRIVMCENGRITLRGLHMSDGYPALWHDEDEIQDLTVDWSRWLGSETISASAWATDDNATLSGASNTTTTASITVSGDPATLSKITNTITTSGGQKKQVTVRVQERTA